MPLLAADDLVGLVALAGQDDDVLRLGVVQGVADGLHPVLHHRPGGGGALQPRQDLPDDVSGDLGAGVVGGDDDEVRQPGGNAPHLGALAPVPVAAAAEQEHHPALGEAPDRGEDVLDGVGGDGIVDENGVVPGDGHDLRPALDPFAGGESRRRRRQGNPQDSGGRQHPQGVVDGKAAGDAHMDGDGLLPQQGVEGHAVRRQADPQTINYL